MNRKRALVTGGSRGIGKAICIMLAKNNYDVLLNYRGNSEAAEKARKEIESFGVTCTLLQFDISNFEDTTQVITEELANNGEIDVLVINAGIRKDSIFQQMKQDEWDSVIDVNLKSFYYIEITIVEKMFFKKEGKIVVISSTSGQTGMPGQANYCASKFGIIGAAKSLAVEVGRRNINVNVVAPGFIETDMTEDLRDNFGEVKKTIPLRRIGSVDDIANAVEFLISDKASYIQGQVIAVNGGLYT